MEELNYESLLGAFGHRVCDVATMKTLADLSTEDFRAAFVTFEHIAAHLDRSRSYVEKEVKRGRLHAVRFGARCRLVSRESFEAYLVLLQKEKV